MSLFSWLPCLSLETVCGNQNSSWAKNQTDHTYSYLTHGRVRFHRDSTRAAVRPNSLNGSVHSADLEGQPGIGAGPSAPRTAPAATLPDPALSGPFLSPPPSQPSSSSALLFLSPTPPQPFLSSAFLLLNPSAPQSSSSSAFFLSSPPPPPCSFSDFLLLSPPLPRVPAEFTHTRIALRVWITLKRQRNWGALRHRSFSTYICLNCL